ncbi:DNA cytosine methyltransferase [Nonomuraea sp. NPDC047897]|uniref:DNA cytosine methyltransferase n=1 Tax=Nonomuraea sp. NPDC047897 TaxID=3364346 RepID=UPI00371A6E02
MLNRLFPDDIDVVEMFAGGGGSGTGIAAVPGTKLKFAANHAKPAKWTYVQNHPHVDFWLGDVQAADAIEKFPYASFFWASPACPAFSTASGEVRYFDKENQMALWADDLDDLTEHQKTRIRSRALMEEVVTYLRHCQEKHGKPVLGFGVENVVQARLWAHWDRWIRELRKLGYIIQIHAVNAAHVQGRTTLPTPQSRDRMLVSAIHESVGRLPNYRKWFDPYAFCPRHEAWVQAVRAWKRRGVAMGVYGIKNGQYVWVCPEVACQNQIIEPPVLPAAYTIDWTDLGTPIGSRKKTKKKPEGLAPKTIARIRAGVEEHWIKPFITPAGGTWNDGPRGVDEPIPALTTREANALVVPCEGRDGKVARPVSLLKRTSTTRNEDGVAFPPDAQPGAFPAFMTLLRSDRARNTNPTKDPLATLVSDGANGALATDPDMKDGMLPLVFPFRGGGDEFKSRPAFTDPAHAVTAGGFHHGLGVPPGWTPPPSLLMRNNGSKGDGREHVTPTSEHMRTVTTTGHQSLITAPPGLPMPEALLMAYYGNGRTQGVNEPVGTLPTRDRWALLTSDGQIDVSSILFRMLRIHELRRAQSFPDHYEFVADSSRDKVKLIGNAVPPPMAEILTCAVVEAILGIELDRFAYDLAA